MKNKLMSVDEYAEHCEVSRSTVYNRIAAGEIITTKVSGTFLIDTALNPKKPGKTAGRKSAKELAAQIN